MIGFDAVKHLVLCRIEKRPPRLNLLAHPYLPRAEVATTSARSYMGLLKESGQIAIVRIVQHSSTLPPGQKSRIALIDLVGPSRRDPESFRGQWHARRTPKDGRPLCLRDYCT